MTDKKYNILELHSKIINTFESEKSNLSRYKSQYDILKNTDYTNFSPKYKQQIEKSIKNLESYISNIENNTNYNYFILETIHIINKYKTLLTKPVIMSFFGSNTKNTNDDKEKDRLLNDYIVIAKKYMDIESEQSTDEEEMICTNCNKDDFFIVDNEYTCVNCGMVEEVLNINSCIKDIDRINISVKYTYDRQIHFKECINKFQGKYTFIEPKVFEDLEQAFIDNRLLDEDNKNKYHKITKKHIIMFLKEYGHTKYYYDINYLYAHYSKIPPHDISHIEQNILEDFNELTELYDQEFEKWRTEDKNIRKNFINTHYVLFQLLRRYKYPCKVEDFNMLKTYEKRIYHDNIIQHLFCILNWNYSPYI